MASGTAMWKLEVDGRVVLAAGPPDAGPEELIAASDLDALITGAPTRSWQR